MLGRLHNLRADFLRLQREAGSLLRKAFKRAGLRHFSDDPVSLKWLRDTVGITGFERRELSALGGIFDGRCLEISWIIPDFWKGAGGHMTIFRMVEFLARFGHRQTIWIQNARNHDHPALARKRIQEWYRPIPDSVAVRWLPDDCRQLSGDCLIATDCWTVYPAMAAWNFKERFYFIQDFEPMFHAVGDHYLVAEETYRMGLAGLCAGPWLVDMAQRYGMWARGWSLASDEAFYYPPAEPRRASGAGSADPQAGSSTPLKIAVYARSNTPRRAVGLALAGLEELHRRGVAFEAHLFGEEKQDYDPPFPHRKRGILTPAQLGDLYREADIGLVFSATNYSLIPLEMMACGLPVVEIDAESTRAVFGNREALLTRPSPPAIAQAIEALAADAAERAAQVERGFAFVRGCDWERSARAIEAALVERLTEKGFRAVRPEEICAPARLTGRGASVVIPAFNAGPAFAAVLERTAAQVCERPHEVLVVDSGSTDGTVDLVKALAARNPRVRLHEIPNREFQHGRTRNLGVSLTDGDHVAFLTQDALPADERWLAELTGAFSAGDRVGGAFGRHRAYAEHGPFVARDLEGMFDRFAELAGLYSLDRGLPGHIWRGGLEWRMLMHFYSDNNSALSRALWREMPYPEIDWGEDQVWAWEILKAGFQKAYADKAVVYHSHPFEPGPVAKVARIEGRFFAQFFGYRFHNTKDDVQAAVKAANGRDRSYARKHGIGGEQLAEQERRNEIVLNERFRSALEEQSGGAHNRTQAISR